MKKTFQLLKNEGITYEFIDYKKTHPPVNYWMLSFKRLALRV
jgi:arsenate reductase-like glutaredoxin family protein